MADSEEKTGIPPARGAAAPGRISIEDGRQQRPFMRGIMVHSLMARGVPFEDAYQTAEQIRLRIRGRGVVQKSELAKAVLEILGPEAMSDEPPPPIAPDISIGSPGQGQPFSKGVLSQSLLAAAIEPSDAFDVAREIERDLVGRGIREIERRELRVLTYEMLKRRASVHTAERYLVWRKYQDPDRPVIILLGGAAGVGKTSLALEVAHRLGIGRMLSTDSIRQILRLTLSRELVPAIHGSSYDAHREMASQEEGAAAVLEGFRAQTSTVSVGIRASMDRAVAENASLVMDGVSLVPGSIDLEGYEELADVIFLVVATLDEQAFRNRFAARAQGQKRRAPHRYLENIDAILQIQEHFLDQADRHGVPIVDNVSFDRSVVLLIRHVVEALRERGGFQTDDLL
jgi:2-phosphoglycerate kinase